MFATHEKKTWPDSAYFTVQRKARMSWLTNSHLGSLVLLLLFKPRSSIKELNLRLKHSNMIKTIWRHSFHWGSYWKCANWKHCLWAKKQRAMKLSRSGMCCSVWKTIRWKALPGGVTCSRTQARHSTELPTSEIFRLKCSKQSSFLTSLRERVLRARETKHLRDEKGYRYRVVSHSRCEDEMQRDQKT